jgi:hypothetical protein
MSGLVIYKGEVRISLRIVAGKSERERPKSR